MKYFLILIAALCISCAHTCPCADNIKRIEYELDQHKSFPAYERIELLKSEIKSIKRDDSLEQVKK